MAGLRETKKARTRQHIADTATLLFVERGFEQVTIAEIADAAEVSRMTVFNHYPRKEDMFLDRVPGATALITEAVRDRPAGTSPVQALRGLAVTLVEQRHPLSGVLDSGAPWLRTMQASPSLRQRALEVAGEIEVSLAAALERDPDTADDARLLAALVVAAYRTLFLAGCRRILAGDTTEEIVGPHLARLHTAFDALDAAARTLGT